MRRFASSLLLLAVCGSTALADDGAPLAPPSTTGSLPGDGFMFGPLVTPMGVLDVHGGIPIFLISTTDAAGKSTSQNIELVSVGASYGVIPKLEIGGDFSINLHPSDSHDTRLELHGAFEILPASEALSLGVAGAIGIENSRGPDGMGGTSSTTDFNLGFGAWLRYAITHQLAVFTGRAPGPYTIAGFSTLTLPPIRQQLNIGLSSGSPISLDVPIALWFQATSKLAAGVSTDIARLGISNSNNELIFKDGIPIALGLNFEATDQVIVGVDFVDDLKHFGDFYAFVLKAGFRIGT